MADKRIIELEERLTLSDGDYFATDNTNGTCKVNAKILLDRLSDDEDAIATKAAKVDLTNISITGSTNNTGSTITSGSFFYKDGTLVRAKTDIANNATLTLNTNYEIVTAGGLNALNNALNNVKIYSTVFQQPQADTIGAFSQFRVLGIPSNVTTPLGAIVTFDGMAIVFGCFYGNSIYALNPTNQSINLTQGMTVRIILFYL